MKSSSLVVAAHTDEKGDKRIAKYEIENAPKDVCLKFFPLNHWNSD